MPITDRKLAQMASRRDAGLAFDCIGAYHDNSITYASVTFTALNTVTYTIDNRVTTMAYPETCYMYSTTANATSYDAVIIPGFIPTGLTRATYQAFVRVTDAWTSTYAFVNTVAATFVTRPVTTPKANSSTYAVAIMHLQGEGSRTTLVSSYTFASGTKNFSTYDFIGMFISGSGSYGTANFCTQYENTYVRFKLIDGALAVDSWWLGSGSALAYTSYWVFKTYAISGTSLTAVDGFSFRLNVSTTFTVFVDIATMYAFKGTVNVLPSGTSASTYVQMHFGDYYTSYDQVCGINSFTGIGGSYGTISLCALNRAQRKVGV